MVISDKFGNGGHVMKIPTAMDDSSVGLQKPEVGRQPNLDIQPALNIKRSDEQSQPVQYSIPGILHFIQHEWARFELERSQWEVDRAEFEARIAFLQGERKGQENLKNDLVRRIKMLEYALKQERAKFHKLKYGVDLQQGEVKPPAEEAMTDQDIEAKMPWKQGRQLIRQYLREIGYADTILDVRSSRVQALLGLNNNSDQDDINLSLNGTDPVVKHSNVPRGFTVDKWRLKNSNWKEEGESGGDALLDGEAAVFANFEFLASQDVDMDVLDDLDAKQASAVANSQSDEDVDHAAKEVLNELNLYTEGDSDIGGQGDDYPGGGGGAGEEPLALGLGELAQLSVSNEAEAYDASQPQNTKDSFRKTWNAKYTLRSHFDGVRALAFHPTEPELVTASEDHTLKLWNLQRTVPAKKTAGLDVEPLYTFRGHRGPALCLAVDGGGGRCWSGGLDGAVRAWRLPRPGADPYDAFEPDALGPPLAGHADAVWSLARRGARLLSASADGALRLWAPDAAEPLLATLRSEADGAPACADFAEEGRAVACYAELAALAFDLETGAAVLRFGEGEASPAARVAAHPSAPLVVTAHEDRRVRFWDARSGRLAHSMVAHLDAVTSLAVDPNGLFLLSGSHDCSIRLWNLDTKTCVQEITAHRKKFDESILDVAFHPSRPYIASAGADSLAKVFV